MTIEYPTRCRILDVTGKKKWGLPLATPEVSKPFIGEEGLAEEGENGVKITLDSGKVIFGYECWWEPIKWNSI